MKNLTLATIVLFALVGCAKQKSCEEATHRRSELKAQIESIKSFHAENHCCNYHPSAFGYNTTLSNEEVQDIILIEQNISFQEDIMFRDCKKLFKEHDYEFYQ